MFARALIVLLLALNLGVASWWALRAEPEVPRRDSAVPGVPRLQLLGDAEPETADRAEAATAAADDGEAVAPAPSADVPLAAGDDVYATAPADGTAAAVQQDAAAPLCIALGPYADEAAAAAARNGLQASIQRSAVRATGGNARGWRVYLPALADREAAAAMAVRLRDAGFSDLYIVADGSEAHSISLGRFGSEPAARNHAAALQAAGFGARAEALGQAGTQYWIDVFAAAGSDAQALRRAATAPQLQRIACDAVRG